LQIESFRREWIALGRFYTGGMMAMFESQRERLLQSLDAAHDAYYRAGIFGGPSLHFHLRALEAGKGGDLDSFSESAYALLAAWGMHRMGRGGSKMVEFEEFHASLKPLWATLLRLQRIVPDDLDGGGWQELSRVFCGISCMATGTSLVGNSKVLAHAIPNLVPPVDREYTLKFLYGSGNIANHIDRECQTFQTILRDFFYPVAGSSQFQSKAREWLQQPADFRWDTSPLKIVDNLVIGLMKTQREDEVIAGLKELLLHRQRDAKTLTSADIPAIQGVYVWYSKSTGEIFYIGKATGKTGLRKRIWGQHLNPNYLESRTAKFREEDAFQKSCGVLLAGKVCVDKSVFRRSLGRRFQLAPGQATVDYIRENLTVAWLTSDDLVGEIPRWEKDLIRELNPTLNVSGR
jgi:hypothetical protein